MNETLDNRELERMSARNARRLGAWCAAAATELRALAGRLDALEEAVETLRQERAKTRKRKRET